MKMKNLESEEFWRDINPDLKISNHPFLVSSEPYILADPIKAMIRQQVIEYGYFSLPPVVEEEEISTLRSLVQNLDNHGVMPVFCAVYDEFWKVLYRLRYTLDSILGADYKLVPEFWIWHVEAASGTSGWKAHRDGNYLVPENIREDGTPTVCTAWLALTDVDTSNSTIYVLPRKHDPLFQDFIRRKFGQPGIPNADQIPLQVENIQALPAKAGSLIGWDTNILHWGSNTTTWATGPRMSVGIYYQSKGVEIEGREFGENGRRYIEYYDPNCSLSFTDRLRIVANNIDTYRNQLDKKLVYEKHYNNEVRKFRDKWKWII